MNTLPFSSTSLGTERLPKESDQELFDGIVSRANQACLAKHGKTLCELLAEGEDDADVKLQKIFQTTSRSPPEVSSPPWQQGSDAECDDERGRKEQSERKTP